MPIPFLFRRLAVLGLFTVLFCRTGAAQVLTSYGLRVGYTRSALVTDYGRDATNYSVGGLDGVHLALFAEGFKRGARSVVAQVEYGRRGFGETYLYRMADDSDVRISHGASHLDYISVPILLKLEDTRDRASAYGLVGPQVDFLVHRSPGTLQTIEGPAESYLADAVNRWGAGVRFGAGMEIRGMLPLPLQLEATYYLELTNGFSGERVHYGGESVGSARRAFDFSVGFRL